MSPLLKVLLGFGAIATGLAVLGKGPGDKARADDVVLVPARTFPIDPAMPAELRQILQALRTDPNARDMSVLLRVERATDDALVGTAIGVAGPNGRTEVGDRPQEQFGPIAIPKDRVVGILKRGQPVADGGVSTLEEGSFA